MLIVKNLNHTKLLFDMSKYTLHRKWKFQVTLLEKTRGKTMKKLKIHKFYRVLRCDCRQKKMYSSFSSQFSDLILFSVSN